MKQSIFTIALLILVTFGASAQKIVRDSIRSGNKAFEEQRYNQAESNYKSAVTNDPTSKEASYNLANTYYKQSRWDDAIKEYEHYLTLENENLQNMAATWHNIGNTLLKKKDLKQSMEAYKNALRLNPSDDESRYNLAVVQKIVKDQEGNGGKDDQQKDQKDDKKEEQKQDQKPDQKQDQKEKKPEKQENEQLSRESANQILQAIEQDEKETQERVKQMKAQEKKKQNEDNRRQNKDW